MGVFVDLKEFAALVQMAFSHAAIPGPDRDIGNRVIVTGDISADREALIEHVELAFDLHCEAVDRVFNLDWGIGVEVPEPTAKIRRATHLPE